MTAAWWTGFYHQRQGTWSFSAPFGRASPSVVNRLTKAGSLLTSTSPMLSVRAMPSVSRTATSVKPSTQGWSRTNDVRFRKPALYPLSYRGVCRLVARASQLVFRFDGIHVIPSPVAMALRLPRLSPTGMMVFIARSTRPLDCPSNDGPRDSTPRFLAVRRCDRAPRGIRTHNPRFKRPLL